MPAVHRAGLNSIRLDWSWWFWIRRLRSLLRRSFGRYVLHLLDYQIIDAELVAEGMRVFAHANETQSVPAFGKCRHPECAILRDVNFWEIVVKDLWPWKWNL